jgi:hypothetical protein
MRCSLDHLIGMKVLAVLILLDAPLVIFMLKFNYKK